MAGEKTALDRAVEEYRQRELQEAAAQGELFGELPPLPAPAPAPAPEDEGGPRRVAMPNGGTRVYAGQGKGIRKRRTDEAARIYLAEFGDPLRRGTQISALPILAQGVLEGLAQRLGCDRFEAAKWWAGIYAATMPYLHQRLASLTIKPEGSPDGEPAQWAFSDDGELVDVTPQAGEAREDQAA